MSQPIEEHEISRRLRELPRETAPRGFTRDVLRRLDEPRTDTKSVRPWTWQWAGAAVAAALVLGLGLGTWFQPLGGGDSVDESKAPTELAAGPADSRDRDAARARLEALQAEHRRLAQELEELHDLTRENEPFVYLGGDEQVDFVYGLDAPSRNGYENARNLNLY